MTETRHLHTHERRVGERRATVAHHDALLRDLDALLVEMRHDSLLRQPQTSRLFAIQWAEKFAAIVDAHSRRSVS
jgi:hypothetical protein